MALWTATHDATMINNNKKHRVNAKLIFKFDRSSDYSLATWEYEGESQVIVEHYATVEAFY